MNIEQAKRLGQAMYKKRTEELPALFGVRRVSQGIVAKLCNVTRSGYAKWEQGESLPEPHRWEQIERAFQEKPGWIAMVVYGKSSVTKHHNFHNAGNDNQTHNLENNGNGSISLCTKQESLSSVDSVLLEKLEPLFPYVREFGENLAKELLEHAKQYKNDFESFMENRSK